MIYRRRPAPSSFPSLSLLLHLHSPAIGRHTAAFITSTRNPCRVRMWSVPPAVSLVPVSVSAASRIGHCPQTRIRLNLEVGEARTEALRPSQTQKRSIYGQGDLTPTNATRLSRVMGRHRHVSRPTPRALSRFQAQMGKSLYI